MQGNIIALPLYRRRFLRVSISSYFQLHIHTLDLQSLQRGLLSLVQQQQHKMKRAKPKELIKLDYGFFAEDNHVGARHCRKPLGRI